MRRVSTKRRKRNDEVREWRHSLIKRVGRCEICGYDPVRSRKFPRYLAVHEVARGCHRDKALDKGCAVLVVCNECHMGPLASRAQWPEARQLAALFRSRPLDYDLAAYNSLVNRGPQRVTEEDVTQWL